MCAALPVTPWSIRVAAEAIDAVLPILSVCGIVFVALLALVVLDDLRQPTEIRHPYRDDIPSSWE